MAIGSPQWMYASGEAYTVDQSLKFEDTAKNGTGSYLTRTPASAGNSDLWTYSCWAKGLPAPNANSHETQILLSVSGVDTNDYLWLSISNDGTLDFRQWDDSSGYFWRKISTALYRDPSSWYHYVVTYDSANSTAEDRIKMYVNGERITSFGTNANPSSGQDSFVNKTKLHAIGRFSINGVVQTDGALNGYLAEVNLIDGQALTPADFGETGDYGEWKPKEYSGTYGTNGFYLPFKQDYTVEGFSTVVYKGSGGANYIGGVGFKPDLTWIKSRNAANYHNLHDILRTPSMRLSSNATDAENNGSAGGATPQFSSFNNDGFSLSTSNENTNSSSYNYVAWNWDMGADTPTGFGCVTWTGNGGTQNISGFGFSPDLVIGKGRSNGGSSRIVDTVRGATKTLMSDDTGAEYTGNAVASFEPDGFVTSSGGNLTDNGWTFVAWGWDMGGTTVTNTSGTISSQVRANPTYGQSIVSWSGNSQANASIGHGLSSAPDLVITKSRTDANDWVTDVSNITGTTGDALRLNNTSSITANSSILPTKPSSSVFYNSTDNGAFNVSNKNYISYCFHSVSGYSKIGSYSGSGSSGNTITTGFRPAFVMVKNASTSGENWYMFDSTREPLGELDTAIKLDETGAEATSSTKKVEFTDTGFKLNSTNSALNASGSTYIYLAFAGGMDSISDYNTDGSIDSRVKANTTYGQSIVSYTGSGTTGTVGHGLSSAPEMYIVKNRDAADDWAVYHTSLGNAKRLGLNDNVAEQATNNWDSTSPTSSVFTVKGGENRVNDSGEKYITYCFHSVTGYSKFGSFSGNGSTTGVVTTVGFEPAFLMVKRTDTAGYAWVMIDNARSPTNPRNKGLYANLTATEVTSNSYNFTSTSFQPIVTDPANNASGGTYIYMAFADTREYAYWLDQSGNNNDWTSNNLTESDISVDSPTNNFATLNPLNEDTEALSEGNLQIKSRVGGSGNGFAKSTMAFSSGKWYAEYLWVSGGNGGMPGISPTTASMSDGTGKYYAGATSKKYSISGTSYTDDGSYGSSWNVGDIIGIAMDADANTLTFYRNNVSMGTAYSSLTDEYYFSNATLGGTENIGVWNFGQDSSFAGNKTAQGNQDSNDIGDFYYEPPSGFLALCTDNLPDVPVVPSEHFNTVLYTGNGSTQSISNVGFQPDWVWLKNRSVARNHGTYDAIRGATKDLMTNNTDAETTRSTGLTAFDSDGFSLGSHNNVNENTADFVSWNWKAPTSSNLTAAGERSMATTSKLNADAKFEIITYTGNGTAGAKIGHSLGVAPELLIIRRRNAANTWTVYLPPAVDETKKIHLETYDPVVSNGTTLNSTAPTSTAITLGNDNRSNGNGDTYVIYAFASVDGYSKFGTYTGNANADGTFVYTGFRPMWVMVKRTTSNHDWDIYDSKRSTFNAMDDRLRANDNTAEADGGDIDFTSNGFKLRQTGNGNGSGDYIYLAFAETPFKYSNGR